MGTMKPMCSSLLVTMLFLSLTTRTVAEQRQWVVSSPEGTLSVVVSLATGPGVELGGLSYRIERKGDVVLPAAPRPVSTPAATSSMTRVWVWRCTSSSSWRREIRSLIVKNRR